MIREVLILNLLFLAGFFIFRNIKPNIIIWIPASFTLFISIMLLPILLDIEHKFSNISFTKTTQKKQGISRDKTDAV
jgi:hypothetical protein